MACGLDKVHTGMNSVVHDIHAIHLILSVQIGIITLFDILDNRLPGLVIIDKVTEAGRIDYSETQSDTVLFDVSADGLDRYGLRDDVKAGSFALLGWI